MKRRVLSLMITLALCLNLCPVWVLAADGGSEDGLCPHHPAHTEECGYAPPTLEQACTHTHDDDCYTTGTDCIHEHTAACYSNAEYDPEVDEPDLCTHVCTEDSGCVTRTLSCTHEHDDTCGYVPGNPGSPCTFVCPICPIEDRIDALPRSVTVYNSEQVQAQLDEIYALYDALTEDEQRQVDLSPCVSLREQIDELDAAAQSGETDLVAQSDELSSSPISDRYVLDMDMTLSESYTVPDLLTFDTREYTFRVTNTNAIHVGAAGELYLIGKVTSERGAGVLVDSGGFLSISGPNTVITGTTCALDIRAGARVSLSAGKYTAKASHVIQTVDNDFAALLAPGCAYFDENGNPLLPDQVATAKTVIVGACTDHSGKHYTHTPGTTEHTWTCPYCGATETEPCTFTFDDNGNGTDIFCGNSITIAVNGSALANLVYDGMLKPETVAVTATLDDGTVLRENTDYKVDYEPRINAGEITLTVTGLTFNGTFTKTYQVSQDRPVLEWNTTDDPIEINVDYDGDPVEPGDLPPVKINIQSTSDHLENFLQYSYKKAGDAAYTDGLPTNAGTYEVIVSLPEMQNFEAAVSDPITLTIHKISPIVTAPVATQPVFNGAAQELVTAGTLHSAAARDGVEIKFASSENGSYSAAIPTGINAKDYTVWYQTEETDNYNATPATPVQNVLIQRKPITPIVKLSDYTYLYDGGYKQPSVEVRDEDDVTVLLDTEYEVEYVNNRNVSTDGNPAKVIVTDKDGGNYEIDRVEVEFKITSKEQAALSITDKPNIVTYGDKFTLDTEGGSGNGDVTWEITDGKNVAEVGENSGQVIVTGDGTFTVKATKSGKDPVTGVTNYDDATATWTITADKKAVVATVTAEDKDYNGNNVAIVHAVVETGVLPGDEITINGLEGTFDDANAGVDKTVTVTVDPSKVSISGTNCGHYDVSYSSLTVTATIHKAIADIKTPPVAANLTYNGSDQALIDATGLDVDPSSVLVEYALNENGPYSTAIPQETDAGIYKVWYRVKETGNYTGLAPASVTVTIQKKQVSPTITLSGDGLQADSSTTPSDYYIYDGTEKMPDVTLAEPGGATIPAGEYTVKYSGNTNVGIVTVTVTAKEDGNYSFTITKNFEIRKEPAQVVTPPEPAGLPLTFSTYAQKLVTEGEGYGGKMVYFLADPDDPDNSAGTYEGTIPTATNAGEYTVYYKVAGDDNHSDSAVGQVKVTIAPKTVKDPTIELELLDDDGNPIDSYTYDGIPKEPTVTVKDGSDVIGAGEYNIIYSDNVDAGKGIVDITDKPGGNYTVTGSATFVILKADIVFAPGPSDAQAVYNGTAQELLNPGTTSGGEVLYALKSATSTYTAAIPTAINAGQYTVYYKVVGDKNHNDFAVQSVTANILRKPLTNITIKLTPEGFEYDGQSKLPEVTVMDGKTVLPEEEYTWSCDDNTPTNEGNYTITIVDAPGGNYDLSRLIAPANQATFAIGKTAQAELVIDHSNVATTNYGDTFTLTASGGSGTGTVTWGAIGPATVDTDGNVKITGVGEVTVTATNPGDQNYLPIDAQWTFTAAPKPVTASVTVKDKDYDGTTDATVDTAGIDGSDLVNGSDVVTIDKTSIIATFDTPAVGTGKTVTLDAGKVKVDGKDAAKYAISYPDTVTAEIKKTTTAITTQPQAITSLIYTGQPQALITAGETNVGFLVYSLNGTDFSPEIPTGTDAGSYTVYYKVDGTADYTAETGGPITVTIDRKTITATVEPSESSYVYDGAKHEPNITVKDGRTVIDEDQYTVVWKDDNSAAATDVLKNVGTYTATITGKSDGNYDFTATATVEIVLAPQGALTITGQPEHVFYGDTVKTLSTTGGTGEGTVTWSITSVVAASTINAATGELTVKDTGSITVKAERTVPNYGAVSATWTFTVEPKPVVAEVTITAKAYNGTTAVAAWDISATVKTGDLVDPANDSITISNLTGTYDNANAGTGKTVTLDDSAVVITGDTDKYAVSCPDTVKADITPRAVEVAVKLSGNDLLTDASGDYYNYDGTEKIPNVTVTGTDTSSGYSATLAPGDYTVSYADNKNVGTATVTVKRAEGGNYAFDDETVNFAIREAAAILTRSPQANDLTYTGQAQELVTVGAVSGGHLEYSPDGGTNWQTTSPTATNADTYVVSYKVVGDDNHKNGPSGSVTVTIKPKEIVSPKITVSGNYTYDGTPQIPDDDAIKVEDGTTVIPDTEYFVSFRNNTDAGTATAVITNANGGNYIVNGTGAFTIAKAAASVGTDPVGQENLPYNGTAQELVTAGSASGGTMVYSLNQTDYSTAVPKATAVDSYTVWYKVQGDSNHEDTDPASVNASIVTNKVSNPVIQVVPASVTYNAKKQEPTVTILDDKGLPIDGSEYTVTYADEDGNDDLTSAGTYTVIIKNTTSSNYEIDDRSATFTILPADQAALEITGTRQYVYYGDKIQLGTTGGSGTITWKVESTSNAASIDSTSGLLTITGVGSVKVTATSEAVGYTDQTAAWSFYADRKPVTAVVSAASKPYDGLTGTTVTATLQGSDLVAGDTVEITLDGTFGDPYAGTDKSVRVDLASANFTAACSGNYTYYNITYPSTTTASIFKADIDLDGITEPTGETDLTYTGNPQYLLATKGSTPYGTMEYSTDGTVYSDSLPTGTDAKDYSIWYRVKGDNNHNDTAGVQLTTLVTIDRQPVSDPTIEFTPNSVSYDGQVHKPTVKVKDTNGREIPDTEYTVEYGSTDWTIAGAHTVTIKGNEGGNYDISQKNQDFTILPKGQNPLSIENLPSKVYYGDSFRLEATGGSGTGAVTWASSNATIADIDPQSGSVTIKQAGGPVTITVTKATDGNYDAVSVSCTFSVEKKPVTAVVTAKDREYSLNDTHADLVITWPVGALVDDDDINLDSVLTGRFASPDVGTNKTVTITGAAPVFPNYTVSWNTTATASITAKTATVTNLTEAASLIYTGKDQELISSSSADGGTIVYSWDGYTFTRNVPTGKDAGTYTIYYKVQADENYKDSAISSTTAVIKPKTVNSPDIKLSQTVYEYDGTEKRPDVEVRDGSIVIPASEYTVTYTDNINVGMATVEIEGTLDGNYDITRKTATFEIKAGTATLIAPPEAKNNLSYNGYAQALVTAGTASNGHLEYSTSENSGYSTTIPKETNAGTYEVWYKVVGENGAGDTTPDSVIVTIEPKLIVPVVTLNLAADPMEYTGSALKPTVTVTLGRETLAEGTDYTVSYRNNIEPGTATVEVRSVSGSNYQFTATETFTIAKAQAGFSLEPKAVENLVYTGKAQNLVTAGIPENGVVVLYSTDYYTFTTSIPQETEVGIYYVFAKVVGNATHTDSAIKTIAVRIEVNQPDSPVVNLEESSFHYTGKEITPSFTVEDGKGNVIAANEYTVKYENNKEVSTDDKPATVTVTGTGTHYSFTASANFSIVGADQGLLTITGKKETVYYGDTLSLGVTGGSGDGEVTWLATGSVSGSDGEYKITSSGQVEIKATKAASGGYTEVFDTWTFYAQPKQVKAIVTAADKPYDTDTVATLTVTINSSSLLSGDTAAGVTAKGHFADPNVGANKTVIIDELDIPDEVSEKYDILYPDTITASITPALPEIADGDMPQLVSGTLIYNSNEQALVTDGGTATGGTFQYSLNGTDFGYSFPTAKDAGLYTVWYRVVANSANYQDTAPVKLGTVTIDVNRDEPEVICTPSKVQYDGQAKIPTIEVLDSAGRTIPASEYRVSLPDDLITAGMKTVTVTVNGSNYVYAAPVTGTFEILAASQYPLTIIEKPAVVYYGDTFQLSATGGSGTGKVIWSISEGNGTIATINNGFVTVTGTGKFTVEAYRKGSGNYADSNIDSVTFYAYPKPITPVVTAVNRGYDGTTNATLTAVWKPGDLVEGDEINLNVTGRFESAGVGTNKRVDVMGTSSGDDGNYSITWPSSVTASIYKVDAELAAPPKGKSNLSYTGDEQELLTAGTTKNSIGTIVYSLTQDGVYSSTIPKGSDAGKYSVWYKVADSVNYSGIDPAKIEVEIARATPTMSTNITVSGTTGQTLRNISLANAAANVPGTFAWENDSLLVADGTFNVIFTPDDAKNYNTATFQVTVTVTSGSGSGSDTTGTTGTSTASRPSAPSTVSASTQTTVRNGTASTVLSAADGSRLVQQAAANQSQSIVIQPEISANVTKSEVSIPATTVSEITAKTSAALTVSAPMADVTISPAALQALSDTGGSVSVAAEQTDQAVVLTLTAGGETVENVPGGVTLTVPAEDAGPGTVAVLVHDDGTRETLRKSVVEDGVLSIPLSGSATVEIVDNSKDFADVPATSWAADAVAFASAHELFSGTSETTFSPDQSMSRAMLATVLYSLEGCPEQALTSEFSDVSGDAWYADSIAWATENGIASGYGNGEFGPDDSITREQFVVMLWKYAGSPETSGQELSFTDADQVSGYALEALCWAVEKGILSGYSNGQLVPGGTATRAQAAQMLKNFLENT